MKNGRKQSLVVLAALIVLATAAAVVWLTMSAAAPPTPEPPIPSIEKRVTGPAPAAPRPAPAATVAAARPGSEPQRDPGVVFTAGWGSAPGELGHDIPEEGAPEGPMSFVVDSRGRVFVLDQINRRVQIFEPGKPPRIIPLDRDTFQDLALRGDGGLALLDRLAGKELVLLDDQGAETGRVPLVGDGVSEGGAATALFQRDDGAWVEVEHRELVRLTDAEGRADPKRPSLTGRPTPDGRSLLRARLQRPSTAVVTILPVAGGPPREMRVDFALRVGHLVALAADASGRIFVAAHLMRLRDGPPYDVLESRLELVVLDTAGEELARQRLPAPGGPEEQFRSIRVGADGAVYQLVLDESGATMRRWTL